LKVVREIEELDSSGSDSSRPGWNAAIEAVERGEVKGIVVWNLARFARNTRDALNALDRIEKAGGRVYSATETFGDTSEGRFTRTMFLNMAELESDRARVSGRAARASALDRSIY